MLARKREKQQRKKGENSTELDDAVTKCRKRKRKEREKKRKKENTVRTFVVFQLR